jgi:hypothetical protein
VDFATLAPQQLEPGKRLGLPGAAMPRWQAVDVRRRRPSSQTLDCVERVAGARVVAWRRIAGVRALGADGLGRPCGPREDPYGDEPMAALVLHANREVIHHGAEIALLRDLCPHHAR